MEVLIEKRNRLLEKLNNLKE